MLWWQVVAVRRENEEQRERMKVEIAELKDLHAAEREVNEQRLLQLEVNIMCSMMAQHRCSTYNCRMTCSSLTDHLADSAGARAGRPS